MAASSPEVSGPLPMVSPSPRGFPAGGAYPSRRRIPLGALGDQRDRSGCDVSDRDSSDGLVAADREPEELAFFPAVGPVVPAHDTLGRNGDSVEGFPCAGFEAELVRTPGAAPVWISPAREPRGDHASRPVKPVSDRERLLSH